MLGRYFERITRDLVRRGVRDGLLGGNGFWIAIGALSWLVRYLRRRPVVRVVSESLAAGESILVSAVAPPPFGRKARKLERAERRRAAAERAEIRRGRRRAVAAPEPPAAEA